MKSLDGDNAGQEVLYARGGNRGRLRAHKGSFPDVTLNLDPMGSWAMAHTHHPVTEASLLHVVDLVMADLREAQSRGEGSIRQLDDEPVQGRRCHKLQLDAPPVTSQDRTRPGETLWDVARRNGAEMHVLLHANRGKGWKQAGDARAGSEVRVPRYYASRITLWIDAASYLPLRAVILDHDGQRYEHRDLRVNVGLRPADFDPGNPDYDF